MSAGEKDRTPNASYKVDDEVRFPEDLLKSGVSASGVKLSESEVRITVRTSSDHGLDWQDTVEACAQWYFGGKALWPATGIAPSNLIPPIGDYKWEGTVTMRMPEKTSEATSENP